MNQLNDRSNEGINNPNVFSTISTPLVARPAEFTAVC